MKHTHSKTKIALQSFLGWWFLSVIYKTNKWDIRGEENYKSALNTNRSVIISVWHGNLLVPFMHLAKNNYYGLAGTNRDAEIISKIGLKLGWKLLRGSSSDRGPEIFTEIVKLLDNPPCLIAMTPDGPKGPERIPKPGIIRAAQKTGAVIIPVSSCSTKNWQFINWHTFFLEKPFGKIFLEYGPPISFNKNDNFESCKNILIDSMNKIEQTNRNYAGQ
ncbi:MAG: hypothetical protein CMG41_01410 [Candidatus Marinimicrobia bacterium]|nr:hypothetical protein [Candidatus Neomarinimicrobiota bacterium]